MAKVKILDRRVFYADSLLFREGELGSNAYMIESGRVEVFITRGGVETHLAYLGAGEIVGEMALVSKGARQASVRATEVTVCSTITEQIIDRLLESCEPGVKALLKVMMKRLYATNQMLADNLREEAERAFRG
ncbi:MAG: cyclic nucleotide-binding domain-containing protein [Alphaproteobacteria bacterium]|nr:cyclic nucleotide-binding domain-containing protein [Alphaproteobacteria bacterium]MBU0797888.1 cyclic nucleotide-binding domain-containing protein [Alphaproteobacteria bacterium]MBU0886160.1 cyclic nucleotide-binding domain-containing protein [Alphaproteobacteria bacterium]MBU1812800.1 cyclic nucleotide-binding domain-containing protein [Alphaproteobacteria bacterium]MBU2091779.1 cyclic nucleotide-binding domain-containing protein [Alphaproteobacteria bacterium]